MLSERLFVTATLLPLGFAAFIVGGWPFAVCAIFFLCIAAWEYVKLFEPLAFQPSKLLVVGSVALLVGSRYLSGFANAPLVLSIIVLVMMTYHLFAYERGRDQAATDFGIALGGIMYIGWLGAYFISLRALPEGMWWLFLVMPSIWLVDSTAYFVGTRWGRHKLAPRLSPHKTWEGYLGGVAGGVVGGVVVGWVIHWLAPAGVGVGIGQGALLGLLMGVLPTLGDLGESMIKRQVHAKDSGNLIPGHGGFFDRIDSWLWAAVIAYYTILWLF